MVELRKVLLQKLHERYPGDIPVFIIDRFNTEWEYFTWTELIEIIGYASGNYSRLGKLTAREMADLIQSSNFRHVLYSQNSLQFYLRRQGIPEILDRKIIEQLITGRKGWEMEHFRTDTPLLEKDKLFNSVSYLRSRTQIMNWLWRYHSPQ